MPSSWANVRFSPDFPVVKEDEVGPGLPAHVGEVVGAEVRGEEHRGVQAAHNRSKVSWEMGRPCPLTEGEKEIVPPAGGREPAGGGP